MLELKKGVDILSDIGGIKDINDAKKVFEQKCDTENLKKPAGKALF